MTSTRLPPLLFTTTDGSLAGAEKVILSLRRHLAGSFDCHLALVRKGDGRLSSEFEGPTGNIFRVLFGKYPVIHSHLFHAALLVRVRRIWDSRFLWVHTIHYECYAGQKRARLKEWLDRRFIFPRVDRLVGVSNAVAESFREFPKIIVIPNGLDMKCRRQARVSPKSREIVIGCAAMFRGEKAHDELLKSVAPLVRRWPGLRLRLAGAGPLLEDCRALARKLGIESQVEFLGQVRDMDAFYSSLDLYCQPSHAESFCLAAHEALQYSLPMVLSDVGNLPDIAAQGRFAKLVSRAEPDFPLALSEALDEVMRDLPLWSAKAARGYEVIRQRTDPKETAKKYARLYASAPKPRICMIAPVVTHAPGGLQKQLLLQTRALVELGHEVYVLQRKDPQRARGAESPWSHVRFLETPDPPWLERVPRSGAALKGLFFTFFGLLKLVRHRREIDVLHAHQLYSPAMLGAAARFLLRKPLVVKVTASGPLGEVRALKQLPFLKARLMAFRKINRCIALTPEMKQELEDFGFNGALLRVIPNGVAMPEARAPKGPETPVLRVLYLGRLSSEKGLETLIEAAQRAASSGGELRLDFVGAVFAPRDPMPALETLLSKRCPNLEIKFHGQRSDVAAFYGDTDVFVLPSRSEGMSNALLEAMAQGLCCVASDIAPNKELIRDSETGFLFKTGDASDLARVLNELMEDMREGAPRGRAVGAAARAYVARHHSAPIIGDRLSKLYAEILGENR